MKLEMDMIRSFSAGFGLAMIATAAFAQSAPIGIATCDDFIAKYEVCVSTKVPAAQQATFKQQIDQLRQGWGQLAKTPEGKTQLEAVCKQTSEQMKATLGPQGCSF